MQYNVKPHINVGQWKAQFFLDFYWIFFVNFFDLSTFLDFWNFLNFLKFFGFFLDFFGFLRFLSKLLRLLLKVTKVTTGHQKMPKMGQNSIISSFFARKKASAEGRSPPQELEVGPRSGPYLLVHFIGGSEYVKYWGS